MEARPENPQLRGFVDIVRDYTAAKLIEEKLASKDNVKSIVGDFEPPTNPSMQALRIVAAQVNAEHKDVFAGMCAQLNVQEGTLYSTFRDVSRELFLGRINWGRIVTFVAFSGSLSVHCAQGGLGAYIPEVTHWTGQFMQEELSQWMSAHGGWNGLRDHFGHLPVHPLVSAGLVLTIGAAVVGSIFLLSKVLSPSPS